MTNEQLAVLLDHLRINLQKAILETDKCLEDGAPEAFVPLEEFLKALDTQIRTLLDAPAPFRGRTRRGER